MSSVEFIKLDETAILPTSEDDTQSVFFIYANNEQTVPKNGIGRVFCGVQLNESSKDVMLRVESVDEIGIKLGDGIIGAGSTPHEIKVFVINDSESDITIKKGDKIAKLRRFT